MTPQNEVINLRKLGFFGSINAYNVFEELPPLDSNVFIETFNFMIGVGLI